MLKAKAKCPFLLQFFSTSDASELINTLVVYIYVINIILYTCNYCHNFSIETSS